MKEYIMPINDTAKDWDEMFVAVIRKQEELIRCKDCKYWYAGENINYCRKFWDDDGEPKLYRCTADDFCSRAERKEE